MTEYGKARRVTAPDMVKHKQTLLYNLPGTGDKKQTQEKAHGSCLPLL
jgi:hypothetical protein